MTAPKEQAQVTDRDLADAMLVLHRERLSMERNRKWLAAEFARIRHEQHEATKAAGLRLKQPSAHTGIEYIDADAFEDLTLADTEPK